MENDERKRPQRVRTTRLQEAQLPELIELDRLCAAMYWDIGFDGAEVPVRGQGDFAMLARGHNVLVAEADHQVAGILAWRDESPGVAYLADVSVHPSFQRFGIGTRLVEGMRDEARSLRIEQIVVRCWERAVWALAFYKRQRFTPIDPTSPAKVLAWRDEQSAVKPLTRPGELALWAPVGPAPRIDAADDETMITSGIPEV